jgi:uncharacterized protein (DUF885 family)
MNQLKRILLNSLFLITAIIIIGCDGKSKKSELVEKEFDNYINNIFIEEVQSDSITLNYTLSNPKNYGVPKSAPTLGQYNLNAMKERLAISENYLATLKDFPYNSLTKEQQLTYDILLSSFKLDKNVSDLLLYSEILGPTTGIQAQLPILLAEYNFYTKEDIDNYLLLLPCVSDYFKEIITFEQEKSAAGLFMSNETADSIITQCESFISNKNENFLIDVFNDEISSFKELSEKEVKNYKEKNKDAILNSVIPAYEFLITELTALKGSGVNENGLSGFPDGKAYYEYLIASSTGSSKSIKEIDSLMDALISSSIMEMSKVVQKDTDIFDKATALTYPHTDPEEIINYLKNSITKDFPALEDVNCTIKYVHESLEESLSPAFYLTPPLDNFKENLIYINGSDNYDLSTIFTTIAHEGYPGHLYQTVYFNQQDPDPIRSILNFGGYSEGWATYVELYSYHIAGIDENIANLLENNMIATLGMYAKIDIGINYFGWEIEDTSKYLAQFGINAKADIAAIHKTMIEEPGNYLKYTLGYIEIIELRNKASDTLKNKFNLKDFHEFLLKTGPAPFDVINSNLDKWLKNQK